MLRIRFISLGVAAGVLLVVCLKWASRKYPAVNDITRQWRFSNPTFVFTIVMVVGSLAWSESIHVYEPDKVEHALAALGVLVGGSWTLYLFVLRKGFESALDIDCVVQTEKCGSEFVVALEVVLANIGNRRISAPVDFSHEPRRGWTNPFVYPGDLQIRRVQEAATTVGSRFANWWQDESQLLADVEGLPKHIPLLDGYRKKDKAAEIIEFIMEPGEKYGLANVFVLPAGHYIAKVVFVGQRANEFWSHTLYFKVPAQQSDSTSRSLNEGDGAAAANAI